MTKNKMEKICLISNILLFLWFFLDMFGLKIGDYYLVEAAWKGMDGIWFLIFLILLIIFYFKDKIGKYLLTVFLFMWGGIQFSSHWYYTIFGASEKKLESYNNFFANTYHIVPASNEILIPDLYHIILHILILLSLILMVFYCFKKSKYK